MDNPGYCDKSTEVTVSIPSEADSVISFHGIRLTVKVKKETKVILDDVSGVFHGGFNAILGPTGSGKSSLLDVLAARKDPTNLTGRVLLNQKAVPSDFRLMTGYVVQDDVVMGTLTIRENLAFSAALRLPQSLSPKERRDRVDTVIRELKLESCADSRVGTEFTRGVSGGERKRCNIGMELITAPRILFLDEPTSGLDANTAGSVMRLLHELSRKGKNIIFSIHQPRFTIYRMFDSLVLLNAGRTAYHGPASEAITYFSDIGYVVQPYNNPADFFLDVLMGAEQRNPEAGAVDESLAELYAKSTIKQAIDAQLAILWSKFEEEKSSQAVPKVGYKTSFGRQIVVVSGRTIKNIIRNPRTSILQIAMMIIFGGIVGAIYWQVDDSYPAGLQNRTGALFFIVMNLLFGNLDAVELFVKERAIFMHENISGYYRVSSYFLAKVFCDIIPRRTIPTVLFCAISYFMIGFQPNAEKFFIFMLTMLLVSYSGASLAFFFSAIVQVMAIASLLIALCYVFMLLFAGFLVNLASVLDWLEWIKYVSFFRYGMNGAVINELHGLTFYLNGTIPYEGDQYLREQDISFETPWDLWQQEVALGVMAIALLLLAYIQLLRMKKMK